MIPEHGHHEALSFCGLDPRVLLSAAACTAVILSLPQHLLAAAVGLGLACLMPVVGGLPWRPLLRRLLAANVFILFLWVTLPFAMPDRPQAAFTMALLISLKCNAVLLCFLTLTSGLDLPRMGCALAALGLPSKLIFLLLFTCRHIHIIGEEWDRLRVAAALRGFAPTCNLHTYMTLGNMFGLTLVNSIDRSRRIYEAMLLRGFTGDFHCVTTFTTGRRDILFCSGLLTGLAVVMTIDLCHDIFL